MLTVLLEVMTIEYLSNVAELPQVNQWNALPQYVTASTSLNMFKNNTGMQSDMDR